MTEAEWLACADACKMLEFLRRNRSDRHRGMYSIATDRKLRLFAVACCRRILQEMTDENRNLTIDTAESFADGLVSDDERQTVWESAFHENPDGSMNWANVAAERVAQNDLTELSWIKGAEDTLVAIRRASSSAEDEASRAALLRCVFGSLPFRPVYPPEATLQTANAVALARAIYDERAFDRLPILADALEDAGCTNTAILDHCRQPGEHVRGCWVVDLVLGKS